MFIVYRAGYNAKFEFPLEYCYSPARHIIYLMSTLSWVEVCELNPSSKDLGERHCLECSISIDNGAAKFWILVIQIALIYPALNDPRITQHPQSFGYITRWQPRWYSTWFSKNEVQNRPVSKSMNISWIEKEGECLRMAELVDMVTQNQASRIM